MVDEALLNAKGRQESPDILRSKQISLTEGLRHEDRTGPWRQEAVKYVITCLFCITYIGTGTLTVVIGSTLMDIQILTDTTASEIAWIFPAKSLGLLSGVFLTMALPSRHHIELVLTVSWVFAASMVATAFCTNRYQLMALSLFQGLSVVSIWISGTLLNVRLWKAQKATALYLLSFGLYLGFFIGPALSYNFTSNNSKEYQTFGEAKITPVAFNGTIESGDLLNRTIDKSGENWSKSRIPVENGESWPNSTALNGHVENWPNSSLNELPGNESETATIRKNLATLFSIMSIVVAVCSTLIFIVCRTLGLSETEKQAESDEKERLLRNGSRKFGWFLVGIASMVQFIGDGQVMSTVGSYMKSYIVLYMKLTKGQATVIATAFTGTYVSWAFAGIFFQRKFGPSGSFYVMAQSNLIATVMMFFSGRTFLPFAIGSAVLGIGLSAKSSALVCWVSDAVGMEKEVTYATYLAWALGDMVQATLVGQLFDSHPESFVLVLVVGSVLYFSSFVIGQSALAIYKWRNGLLK